MKERSAPRSYSPRARAERLVAGGRVVLAASSLLAVWLDPSEPSKSANFAYALLAAYLLYAALLAVAVIRSDSPPGKLRLVDHGFDLVFFSFFMYFTTGPTSPFFAYFVFSLVGATLRWQWRGTLWTAVATLIAYLSVGLYFGRALDAESFELDRFIIRSVYLVVVAVLLGYLGLHEARTRREIALLAERPTTLAHDLEPTARESLEWAARVLGTERLVLVWSDPEEPGLRLARTLEGGDVELRSDPEGQLEQWLPPGGSPDISSADAAGAKGRVVLGEHGLVAREPGAALDASLRAELHASSVSNLALRGQVVAGRLLILDRPGPAADALILGEVVAAALAARLDHLHLARRLRESAVTSERIRLARDLHDGVLQSLTGIALHLATLSRLVVEDPAAARVRLAELQRLIGLEQRELRFFVEELRPAADRDGEEAPLGVRLGELAEAIERVWDVDVVLSGAPLDDLPEGLARHLHLLVREAMVNAARHADPRRIEVAVGRSDSGDVTVRIADDGHGFAFEGRHDAAELGRSGLGPRSLSERVDALGGSLEIESSVAGSTVHIELPAGAGWVAA